MCMHSSITLKVEGCRNMAIIIHHYPLIWAVDKVRILTHWQWNNSNKVDNYLLQLYKAQSSELWCELLLNLNLLYLVPEDFPRKFGLLLEGHQMPFSLATYWEWDWNRLFHKILDTEKRDFVKEGVIIIFFYLTLGMKFLAGMEAVWGEVWEVGQEADWGEAGHLDTEVSIRGEGELIQPGQHQHPWGQY